MAASRSQAKWNARCLVIGPRPTIGDKRIPHMKMFTRLQNWFRRWRYQEGTTLSRFIACDIRRDILIISAAKVEQGIIVGRVRTTNVLYLSYGLVTEPEFEPERELRIDEMWHWTGQPWGGLPDGTSIADPVHRQQTDKANSEPDGAAGDSV